MDESVEGEREEGEKEEVDAVRAWGFSRFASVQQLHIVFEGQWGEGRKGFGRLGGEVEDRMREDGVWGESRGSPQFMECLTCCAAHVRWCGGYGPASSEE